MRHSQITGFWKICSKMILLCHAEKEGKKRRSGEVGVQEAAWKRGMERVSAAVVEREKENPKGPLQKSHGG